MEMNGKEAIVWFEDHKERQTHKISMSYPLARKLFSFLNPNFFVYRVVWDPNDLDFGPLRPLFEIWPRVVEVRLNADRLSILPQRHFGKLKVDDVGTVGK